VALLTFDDVSVRTRRSGRQWVLRNVCFELERGRLVGLWPGSESGSRAVLAVVARAENPDAGRVRFGGRDHFATRGPRLKVVTIDPDCSLLETRDALEYVASAAWDRLTRRAAMFEAYAALEWAGVRDIAPVRTEVLSSSERLRVGLAHAVLRRPDLLVGELLLGRDRHSDALVTLLREYAEQSVATLVSLPHMYQLRYCHEWMLVHNGALTRSGSGVELLVPSSP
jgi:ABC-type ATPase involved in cell division